MAVYNTYQDSANTAVRAFLTKVGSYYNDDKPFNSSTGKGKMIWEKIKNEFEQSCCYCNTKTNSLTMEHLIMMNRTEFGLHHPGNVVPCCKNCNKRKRDSNKKAMSWRNHLKAVAGASYSNRLKKIENHIKNYKYPNLTPNEKKTIKVIAESLYKNAVTEGEKSFELYVQLRKEFL